MYKHTQEGWAIIIIGVLMGLVPLVILLVTFNGRAERICIAIAIFIVLAVIVLLRNLTATVDEDKIGVRFGPGLFRKKFEINQIESSRCVKIWPFLEWGISFYPKRGWVYSVSGLDAVEITMKNGKKYRIGSNQPVKLIQAIQNKLHKSIK